MKETRKECLLDIALVGLLYSGSKEFLDKINSDFVFPIDYKKIVEK